VNCIACIISSSFPPYRLPTPSSIAKSISSTLSLRYIYIDLSKRRISSEEAAEAETRFQRSKVVHSIMRHVAATEHCPTEAIYKQTAWLLQHKLDCHPYEAFCAATLEPDRIFNEELMPDLSPKLRSATLAAIRKKLVPDATASVKIKTEVTVSCVGRSGVYAVKAALSKALEQSTGTSVQLKLVAPPLYMMTCECREAVKGAELLSEAIAAAADEVRKYPGGELKAKHPVVMQEGEAEKCGATLIARLVAEQGELMDIE